MTCSQTVNSLMTTGIILLAVCCSTTQNLLCALLGRLISLDLQAQLSAHQQHASPQVVISPPDRQKHCREELAVDRQKHYMKEFAVDGQKLLLTIERRQSGRACIRHSISSLSFADKDAANRCSKPSKVPLLSIVA